MQVNTNVQALVAANAINLATQQAARASERIGSSLRVNSAADDPGSMIMINSIKSKIASWSKANDNITSANGMLQTMSSTLTSVSDLLSKMRALAFSSVTASPDTLASNQTTFAAYMNQMDKISSLAKWNGISLLNNSGSTVAVQAGVDVGNTITVNLCNTASTNLGDAGALNTQTISSAATANSAINQIDKAITTISGYQTAVGASQNIMASQSSYNTGISTANNTVPMRPSPTQTLPQKQLIWLPPKFVRG